MEEKINGHFAIIGYNDGSITYDIIGTGFFINKSGYFISAAHIFRDSDKSYYAVINENLQRISQQPLLFLEKELDSQEPPEHLDLYIGKLECDSYSFYTFKSSSELREGNELEFKGFGNVVYNNEENLTQNERRAIIEASKSQHQKHCLSFELARIKSSSLTGKFKSLNFERLTFLSKPGLFLNGMRFELTYNELFRNDIISNPVNNDAFEPAGYSGGPVLNTGYVVGMLITKDGALTSDYLMGKLDELSIPYSKSLT